MPHREQLFNKHLFLCFRKSLNCDRLLYEHASASWQRAGLHTLSCRQASNQSFNPWSCQPINQANLRYLKINDPFKAHDGIVEAKNEPLKVLVTSDRRFASLWDEKKDLDPRQSEKSDPDQVKRGIWIRIKRYGGVSCTGVLASELRFGIFV